MFIEHIDQLRCTASHDESWLVASIATREGRFVIDGEMGCPVCSRRYPIVGGVAYFGVVPGRRTRGSMPGDENRADRQRGRDPEEAVRVAALLNPSERSTLVLAGGWGGHAHTVAEMLPLTVFVLNPTSPVQDSAAVAVIESSEGVPFARDAVRGIALDRYTATSVNVATALEALHTGGRLVAPAAVDPPPGVAVLARDAAYWVGEKTGPVIPLRRA